MNEGGTLVDTVSLRKLATGYYNASPLLRARFPDREQFVQSQFRMTSNSWFGSIAAFRPSAYLRKIACPTLAAYGAEDQDVKDMEAMFERCRVLGRRTDAAVCTFQQCRNTIEDRIGFRDPDLKKCPACGLAQYCDKGCQRSDWPEHKEVCKKVQALKDLEVVREWINSHPI